MKFFFLLFGLLGASPAFAQATPPPRNPTPQPTDDPQVYALTPNANAMALTYVNPQECATQFERRVLTSHWSAAQRAKQASAIPLGGYLTLAWARPTAAAAAANNFSVLVFDPKGHELKRVKLAAVMVEPLDFNGAPTYPQSTTVPLEQPLAAGTKVFVIEASVGKRYEYLIRP